MLGFSVFFSIGKNIDFHDNFFLQKIDEEHFTVYALVEK